MNRIHRTVWSAARQTYIVAHEGAGTHGKPSSTRKATVSAVAVALLALGAGEAAALAAPCPAPDNNKLITLSSPVDTRCVIAEGESLLNGSSILLSTDFGEGGVNNGVNVQAVTAGSITNNGSIAGYTAIEILGDATLTGGITNNGSISGGSGIYIQNGSKIQGWVVNNGTISTSSAGIYARGELNGLSNNGDISSSGWSGIVLSSGSVLKGVTNTGTISAHVTGIQLFNEHFEGGLTNSGLISGGKEGVLAQAGSTLAGGITNSGTISGGVAGIALLGVPQTTLSGGWVIQQAPGATLTGGIHNEGLIVGGQTGIWIAKNGGSSDSTLTDGITNSGTISGGGETPYAIYVENGSSLDSIHIRGNNTARFDGAVYAPNTPVTVDAGQTYTMLDGQQFAVSGFTNAGTLKIGATTTTGSIGTIAGDFTNTGTFSPTVASMGSYSKLNVSGTATLGGTISVDAANATGLSAGTLSGVITAGTLSGTFASAKDNSVLFDFTPKYTTNGVDLEITSAGSGGGSTQTVKEIVTSLGNTPALSAAAVLDRIFADTSNPVTLLFVPVSTSNAQVSNAVTQTLPLLVGSAQIAGSAALTGINRVIQARIDANRGLSSGNDFYGDKHFWMKPFGSEADQNDRKGVSGYNAKTAGLAFGADATISDKTRLGLSFAYARANLDGNSTVAPNSANVDVYQLVGYGSHTLAPDTELNFQLGVGQNQNKGQRNLSAFGLQAKADYDSQVLTAGAGLARSYKLSTLTSFTPSVRADYTWIKDKGYSETGAGALNLNVQGRTTEELIVAIDGKIAHEVMPGTTLIANLGVGYDVLGEQASITSAYAGAPSAAFTTQGIDPSPWLARGGLGVVTKTASGMEFSLRYDTEHRSDFVNQTASMKVRWAF